MYLIHACHIYLCKNNTIAEDVTNYLAGFQVTCLMKEIWDFSQKPDTDDILCCVEHGCVHLSFSVDYLRLRHTLIARVGLVGKRSGQLISCIFVASLHPIYTKLVDMASLIVLRIYGLITIQFDDPNHVS